MRDVTNTPYFATLSENQKNKVSSLLRTDSSLILPLLSRPGVPTSTLCASANRRDGIMASGTVQCLRCEVGTYFRII